MTHSELHHYSNCTKEGLQQPVLPLLCVVVFLLTSDDYVVSASHFGEILPHAHTCPLLDPVFGVMPVNWTAALPLQPPCLSEYRLWPELTTKSKGARPDHSGLLFTLSLLCSTHSWPWIPGRQLSRHRPRRWPESAATGLPQGNPRAAARPADIVLLTHACRRSQDN